MLDKLGGRKMAIAIISLIAGVIIDLTTTRGLSQNLMYLMLGIIGTFSITNVASKRVSNPATGLLSDVSKAVIQLQKSAVKTNERQEMLEQHASATLSQVETLAKQNQVTSKKLAVVLAHKKG